MDIREFACRAADCLCSASDGLCGPFHRRDCLEDRSTGHSGLHLLLRLGLALPGHLRLGVGGPGRCDHVPRQRRCPDRTGMPHAANPIPASVNLLGRLCFVPADLKFALTDEMVFTLATNTGNNM